MQPTESSTSFFKIRSRIYFSVLIAGKIDKIMILLPNVQTSSPMHLLHFKWICYGKREWLVHAQLARPSGLWSRTNSSSLLHFHKIGREKEEVGETNQEMSADEASRSKNCYQRLKLLDAIQRTSRIPPFLEIRDPHASGFERSSFGEDRREGDDEDDPIVKAPNEDRERVRGSENGGSNS